MNIRTTAPGAFKPALAAPQTIEQQQPDPQPPQQQPSDLVEFGKGFAKGVLPGYGAHANFWSSFDAGKYGDDTLANITMVGTFANVAGTVGLAAGLLTGNGTVSAVSGALLVGAGMSNGYAQIR